MTPTVVARLARVVARRPLRLATVGVLFCLAGAAGFARFGVDAGTGLLVGSGSSAGRTAAAYGRDFGSDPIVVVLTPNPACLDEVTRRVVPASAQVAAAASCLYQETNVIRLAAVESDVARDPRVASVLGPGTIAGSSLQGLQQEVTIVELEYGEYFADLARLQYIEQNHLDPAHLNADQQQRLSQVQQSAAQTAITAIGADVIRATAAAEQARRQALAAHDPNARLVDGPERAAQQAVDQVDLPPGFADFVARLENVVSSDAQAAARRLFDNFTAAYGVCNQQVAQALGVASTCQPFIERFLLDLPNCPTVADFERTGAFCQPKPQWSAALPRQRPGEPARAVITVRLRPEAASDGGAVRAVVDRITADLAAVHPPHAVQTYVPISCGSAPPSLPPSALPPFSCVVAGAPLLAQGVVGVTTHLLAALFPVALLVMLVLLVAGFRVRGRVWPLVAASLATLLTLGLTLAVGVAVTPAVLAGVPVLVGLGVDYAVQLVARLAEERRRGLGVEAAVRAVLGHTGPATLIAALATLVGLLSLAVLCGVDLGPLAAVPFVAEFSLVLAVGIVLAWASAVLVALPVAAWRERQVEVVEGRRLAVAPPPVGEARRTAALAARWRVVVVPAAILALVGWVALPRVPVQTDVERLLAPSLTELEAVNTVRQETGYTNEIDLYLQGDVVGTASASPVPAQVEWQGRVAAEIACTHPDQVAEAVSIADVLAANASSPTASTGRRCPSTPRPSPGSGGSGPSSSPSPSGVSPPASPSPSSTGSTTASPSPPSSPSPSARRPAAGAVPVARTIVAEAPQAQVPPSSPASPPPSPGAGAQPSPPGVSPGSPASASAEASVAPGAGPTPSGAAAPTPAPTSGPQSRPTAPPQGPFVCTLRTFALLARVLVNGFTPQTAACPPIDVFTRQLLAADGTPVDPTAARIVLGVRSTSLEDEAALVHALRSEVGSPPPGISSVEPAGLAALAVAAYDTLRGRALLVNLVPLLLVALALVAIHRDLRRGLLPVLPTALAAGWAPLVLVILGRLPGAGPVLGAFNPLTVVLGALVVALGTEFGVVVLRRFDEERGRGLSPEAAAAATLAGVGRAVGISAATLGAGFAVLAIGGLVPPGLPLVADFGFEVVVDLALAVVAVFAVMLPVAVALAKAEGEGVAAVFEPVAAPREIAAGPARPVAVPSPPAPPSLPPTAVADREPGHPHPPHAVGSEATGAPSAGSPSPWAPPSAPRRLPGVSGRKRSLGSSVTPVAPAAAPPAAPGGEEVPRRRLPGLSGRPRPTPAASAPPPAATPPMTPPPQPRRRLPGSIVPRRPESAPPGEAAGAPSLPPVAPQPVVGEGEPPSRPAPPPPGSSEAPRPRSRRRRPPPHIRRRGRGGPPGTPPAR